MTNKIYLQDILNFSDDELKRVKIKFNSTSADGTEPLDEYVRDSSIVNDGWLFWRKKVRNFSIGKIAVCLVQMRGDTWLLTTVKTVTKELNKENGVNYKGEEIQRLRPYFGRVIVKYHRVGRTVCYNANTVLNKLEVLETLSTVYDGEEFTGYNNVCLSYAKLANIIAGQKASWIGALKSQKAVYVITDTKTGKLYVGSATGKEMLLQRWTNYVADGHGGNKELKKLVAAKGFDYVKQNFQYTILENYNSNIDDSTVLARESYWKKSLCSKKGYNAN